eukprot:COSAG02_NODE_3127_length_7316_cov_6.965360_3_plen_722_part_00
MDFSLSGAGGRGGGGGGGKRAGKAKLVAEARRARAQRAESMGSQREAERQLAAACVLQRAIRRCPCVRRLHLRRLIGHELDADLAAGEPAAPGSLYRLCRRLLLFCDLSLIDDVARFRKLSLLVLKQPHEFCSPAVSDPWWFQHAVRFGGLALEKLRKASATAASGSSSNGTDISTEVRLLVALTDSAGWRVAKPDVAKAKAASARVLGTLVSTWGLHPTLRAVLLGRNYMADEPLWAQAVLTLAARPVLVLDGSGKLDAVRRLVMFQFTIPGLVSAVPSSSMKPLQVVLPAVLQWLAVPQLQARVAPMSKLAVAANCIDAALANSRPITSATLQRLVAVTTGLMQGRQPDTDCLSATEQEAAQLAAAWQPRIVKLLAQATASSGDAQQLDKTTQANAQSPNTGTSKMEPHLPWTVTCEVKPRTCTADPVVNIQQVTSLFFALLFETVAPFSAMQNELVSNLCAVSEPSLLAIVWNVLSNGNLYSLLAAAATRNLGSHSLLRPLQLFLRMGLLIYIILRDDEILGDGEQAFPLPIDQLSDALNLLNQLAFRCLWDGDGLPYPKVDRDICNRCIKLLAVLYQVDERARINGTEIMSESRWRIGSSKLSKVFETELIRRSARATTIAAQMPHLPKRSAAQRLAAAERRRTAFSGRSDPSQRAEALRMQGLEAVTRIDFRVAMQCLCAAIEIDGKNFLAFANRSAVQVRLARLRRFESALQQLH